MFDEQPDGDPHGECAVEIHRLQALSNETLDFLVMMFDAYEEGPDCYEDPDDCSGHIGKANACALTHIEEAQHWLQQRTLERMRRGVEGTHTV